MKKFLLVVALVAAGVSGWWYNRGQTAVQAPPITTEVTRGDLERTVAALGTVEPARSVDVGAQVSGQILKVHVEAGDEVQAGDLLAEIDPSAIEATVDTDMARLEGLEASLTERQLQLKRAEQQYRRQSDLLKANATSREAYEDAAIAVDVAKAQIVGLQADIAQAQSTLTADLANLDRTKLRAPMAGTVMEVNLREGQSVGAGQQDTALVRIADLSTMSVRAQVSEADIGRLREGMEAYFTTLGASDRKWTGVVRRILPTPETVNNVVLYGAVFDVANPDGRLLPQMTAQVFFVEERAEDAVIVPVAALRPAGPRGRDQRLVGVLNQDGAVEERRVTIGLQDRVSVQVLEGLEPGDRVVMGGGTRPTMAGFGGGVPGGARPAGAGGPPLMVRP